MFTLLVQIPVRINDLIEQDLGCLPDGGLIWVVHVEVFHLGLFV